MDGRSDKRGDRYQSGQVVTSFIPTTEADVVRSMPLIRKAGLYFSPSTQLYLVQDDEKPVGACGIVWFATSCKFKNQYVQPVYRGKGYFRAIMDFSIQEALNRGIHVVDATCTLMSVNEYIKRGAVIVHRYKTAGLVRVRLQI